MPFYRYFTKNNAQGVVINDTSSQITFQAGHTLPTSVSSGEYLLTLGGPGGEIVKVTNASQDGSGVLTVDITRSEEGSSYTDATSGTIGYMYLTAGMFNNTYDILEEHDNKLLKIDVTGDVDLDQIEADTITNNAKVSNYNHTGDVTGADVLGIVPAAISGKTSVTPVTGDYLLIWDATDSSLKKVDASNFLSGAVASVNGLTGAVTLVTGNISDTTSTQKYVTSSDITKLGYISVTQSVDLDTMESNISTNNAKITNATHTGDVTGADVLGIVPAAISGKTGVTPVAGDYVLLWDATDSALKKADVSTFINGTYGDVTGPASSTNTGIAIYNGTGGKTLMSSLVTIDTSSITIPGFLTVTGQARQSAQATLTSSGTVTWNINNDPSAKIALTGDVTSLTISGINLNSTAILYITQNASTAYSITWPTITWAGGYAPNISTLSSKHIISFFSYDGTGLFGSIVSDTSLSTLSSTSGTTVANAIAIYDSTTGLAIKDSIATLDISGNFASVGTINGVSFNTLAADTTTNNAKVSNATHTGDVIGSTGLTIDPTAISGKTGVTPVSGDYLLLWDATDSALKKVDASNFLGGGAVTSVNGLSGTVTLVTGDISDTTSTQKYATAAQLAKVDYLTVTGSVNLDTLTSSTQTFTNKRITKRVASISDGTGIDLNSDDYDAGTVTLAGNRTLNYFTGTPTNFQPLALLVCQDATGSRTLTLKDTTGAGSFRVSADVTGLVLSTAANKKDLVLFTYLSDVTGWVLTAVNKGI